MYTFIEQTLQQGHSVSLKCATRGEPLPRVIWYRDGEMLSPVSLTSRMLIGSFMSVGGDIISFINITHVRYEDGGHYKCVAKNTDGQVEHSTDLNVYGKLQ